MHPELGYDSSIFISTSDNFLLVKFAQLHIVVCLMVGAYTCIKLTKVMGSSEGKRLQLHEHEEARYCTAFALVSSWGNYEITMVVIMGYPWGHYGITIWSLWDNHWPLRDNHGAITG